VQDDNIGEIGSESTIISCQVSLADVIVEGTDECKVPSTITSASESFLLGQCI